MFLKGAHSTLPIYLFTVLNHTLQYLLSFFLQDFILEHYSEDSYLYEDEIADLMDLRQVCFCVRQGREDRTAARACRVQNIPLLHTRNLIDSQVVAGNREGLLESSIPLAT